MRTACLHIISKKVATMPTSVFLSHNHADKPFVRRLAADLDSQGVRYWLDEAEIKVGESLIEKIRAGIDMVDFVAVVLSPDSVSSAWVQREVDVAMNQEILGRRVKVLPLMYRKCDPPGFLLGKRYADFTDDNHYPVAFEDFVRSLGLVFNKSAFSPSAHGANLSQALDRAWKKGLPMLTRPFHRPFQYMGMTIQEAAQATGGAPNKVGNIIIDTDECHMFLEAEGNFISFVEIELKRTAPHRQDQEFDSEMILGALSISPSELEPVGRKTHVHTYYDHKRRLRVSVSCLYNDAPLSVGFSSKYYGT